MSLSLRIWRLRVLFREIFHLCWACGEWTDWYFQPCENCRGCAEFQIDEAEQ